MDGLGLRIGADLRRDLEGADGRAFGIPEGAGDHALLGKQGEDSCPLDRRAGRSRLGGTPERGGGAGAVPGRKTIAAEAAFEHGVCQAVPPLAEGGKGALRVGHGPGRAERGVRGLRGQLRQLGDGLGPVGAGRWFHGARGVHGGRGVHGARGFHGVRGFRGGRVAPGWGGGRAGRRCRGGIRERSGGRTDRGQRRDGQREGQLERGQRVLRRPPTRRKAAGFDRGLPRLGGAVRGPPVHRGHDWHIGERLCQRGVVPGHVLREQVRDDRPSNQLVADPEKLAGLGLHQPMLERLLETRSKILVEVDRGPARAGGRTRRQAAGPAETLGGEQLLVGDGRTAEAPPVHRTFGGSEQAQDAPALRGAAREAGGDEVRQRGGERRVAQLAARCDQLLHDQRSTAGPFRDQDDDRR